MQIGPSAFFQWPLLQIIAGGRSFAVMGPGLDVYIGTHPPDSLEKTAVVRFRHPYPVGARLNQQNGVWFLNADPGPVALVDGEGRMQTVPPRGDSGVSLEMAQPMPFALLAPGLSHLIFGGAEKISLLVPSRNAGTLAAGNLVDVLSHHERAASPPRRGVERRAAAATPQAPPAFDEETEETRAIRKEYDRVSEELSELDQALALEPSGGMSALLSKASRMARRRMGILGAEMARLLGHAANLHDSVSAVMDKIQKRPPELTDEEYTRVLAYAKAKLSVK